MSEGAYRLLARLFVAIPAVGIVYLLVVPPPDSGRPPSRDIGSVETQAQPEDDVQLPLGYAVPANVQRAGFHSQRTGKLRWYLRVPPSLEATRQGDNAAYTYKTETIYHPPTKTYNANPGLLGGVIPGSEHIGRTETITTKARTGRPTRRWKDTLVRIPIDVWVLNDTYRPLSPSSDIRPLCGDQFTIEVYLGAPSEGKRQFTCSRSLKLDAPWEPAQRVCFDVSWESSAGIEPGTYTIVLQTNGRAGPRLQTSIKVK